MAAPRDVDADATLDEDDDGTAASELDMGVRIDVDVDVGVRVDSEVEGGCSVVDSEDRARVELAEEIGLEVAALEEVSLPLDIRLANS